MIRALGLGVSLAVSLAACRAELPATELVVTVDTTFGVPCTIDTLVIEADADGGAVSEQIVLTRDALPGSFTLVPAGSPDDVTVTVTGLRDGEPFVVAQDVATFVDGQSLELRFVLDRACLSGPCAAVGVGGFHDLPEPVARPGCGEERYASIETQFAMRDACEMNEPIMARLFTAGVDEDEQPSPLVPEMPFPFRFYGEPIEHLWIGTNGYLGFGALAPRGLASDGAPRSLGGTSPLRGPAVAAFWDDLRTSARGVCMAVTGDAPDRMLWITWKEACFAATGTPCGSPVQGRLTFTVALEETSDRIYVQYQDMVATGANVDRARASTAVIGLTSDAPRGCPAAMCSAEGTCASGDPCGYTEVSALRTISPLPAVELVPR